MYESSVLSLSFLYSLNIVSLEVSARVKAPVWIDSNMFESSVLTWSQDHMYQVTVTTLGFCVKGFPGDQRNSKNKWVFIILENKRINYP